LPQPVLLFPTMLPAHGVNVQMKLAALNTATKLAEGPTQTRTTEAPKCKERLPSRRARNFRAVRKLRAARAIRAARKLRAARSPLRKTKCVHMMVRM